MKLRKYINVFRIGIILTILSLYLFDKHGYTFYVCPLITTPSVSGFLAIMILLSTLYKLYITKKTSGLNIIACFLFGFLFILFLETHYGLSDSSYTKVASPDGSHTFIFYEHPEMMDNIGIVYEQVSPFYMIAVSHYWSEAVYPVRSNLYEIEWNSDHANFIYEFTGIRNKRNRIKTILIPYAR